MKLNRFVMQAQQKKNTSLFHSSGVVQNDSLGSTSTQSFGARRNIEKTRRHIKGYDYAQVVAQPKSATAHSRSVVTLSEKEQDKRTDSSEVRRRSSSQVADAASLRDARMSQRQSSSQIAASHPSGRAQATPRPVFRASSYR